MIRSFKQYCRNRMEEVGAPDASMDMGGSDPSSPDTDIAAQLHDIRDTMDNDPEQAKQKLDDLLAKLGGNKDSASAPTTGADMPVGGDAAAVSKP